MINRIVLRNTATYDSEGVEFRDLRKVNYIYGENGSGKTTLSNFIRDSMGYPECEILWDNIAEMKTLVYNRAFVEENFHQHARLKGIFTLGKESYDIQEKIRLKGEEIRRVDEEIVHLNHSLNQNVDRKNENENKFEEKCWALKLKYDGDFAEAFTGFRGVKAKFKEKCKTESINKGLLMGYQELKDLSVRIFTGSVEKINVVLKTIDVEKVLSAAEDPIFADRIIGKEDIDIGKLITELNISDWVRQGHQHLKSTAGVCPFCQQNIEAGFEDKLDAYFDESFTKKVLHLKEAAETYKNLLDNTVNIIGTLLSDRNDYVDNEKLETLREQVKTKYEANLVRLSQKASEPSRSLTLDSVEDEITAVNQLINSANTKITEHNNLVDNIGTERAKLASSVWRFIAEENKTDHKSYVENNFQYEKAIQGITSRIQSKAESKKILETEVTELERQISSVKPSIDQMNALLKSFNFTNFKFAEAEEKGDYRIIRDTGEDAKETLSEGERTFVTFLYFIQLLNGSTDTSRITEDKVVVFDDPISSLDSNVLFIVSTLVRRIIEVMRNGNGNIQQVFILTHNIHFHKEVSFNKGQGSARLRDETFWILRKGNNVSHADSYDFNPVKTSYQLLWKELKRAEEDSSSTTIQNVLRRIIESYFKNYGGYKEEEIISKFEGEEQVTCRALVSWINDGSHFINDDLYMESGPETVQKYLSVFESIFIAMGHDAHYKMMMEAVS